MAEGQVQAARELVIATEQEMRNEKNRANDAQGKDLLFVVQFCTRIHSKRVT